MLPECYRIPVRDRTKEIIDYFPELQECVKGLGVTCDETSYVESLKKELCKLTAKLSRVRSVDIDDSIKIEVWALKSAIKHFEGERK